MTRLCSLALLPLVLLAPALPAAAQDPATFTMALPAMAAAPMQILDVQPFENAAPVRNAPFSAEAVTEITQTLADGNRIERTLSSSIARDARGRVRREEKIALIGPLAMPGEPPSIITITDPERGHITLDPQRKVAMRMTAPPLMTTRALPAAGLPVPPLPPLPPQAGAGDNVTFFLSPGMPVGAGAIVGGFSTFQTTTATTAAMPDAVTEKLGTRTIEGLEAEGTRTTFTIPARTFGNVNPIDVVTERWYSPELKMALVVSRRDPRTGETLYRLTNIVRAEPPADLFEVPADYAEQKTR